VCLLAAGIVFDAVNVHDTALLWTGGLIAGAGLLGLIGEVG
jgi:hypothetical protein